MPESCCAELANRSERQMAASHDDRLYRYLPVLWGVAAGGVAFAIRFAFGLAVLKQMLPYLMAGPAAYVIIRITIIMRIVQQRQRTAHGKVTSSVWLIVLILWVVGTSSAPFQQLMNYNLFSILIAVGLFGIGVIIQLFINRLMKSHA